MERVSLLRTAAPRPPTRTRAAPPLLIQARTKQTARIQTVIDPVELDVSVAWNWIQRRYLYLMTLIDLVTAAGVQQPHAERRALFARALEQQPPRLSAEHVLDAARRTHGPHASENLMTRIMGFYADIWGDEGSQFAVEGKLSENINGDLSRIMNSIPKRSAMLVELIQAPEATTVAKQHQRDQSTLAVVLDLSAFQGELYTTRQVPQGRYLVLHPGAPAQIVGHIGNIGTRATTGYVVSVFTGALTTVALSNATRYQLHEVPSVTRRESSAPHTVPPARKRQRDAAPALSKLQQKTTPAPGTSATTPKSTVTAPQRNRKSGPRPEAYVGPKRAAEKLVYAPRTTDEQLLDCAAAVIWTATQLIALRFGSFYGPLVTRALTDFLERVLDAGEQTTLEALKGFGADIDAVDAYVDNKGLGLEARLSQITPNSGTGERRWYRDKSGILAVLYTDDTETTPLPSVAIVTDGRLVLGLYDGPADLAVPSDDDQPTGTFFKGDHAHHEMLRAFAYVEPSRAVTGGASSVVWGLRAHSALEVVFLGYGAAEAQDGWLHMNADHSLVYQFAATRAAAIVDLVRRIANKAVYTAEEKRVFAPDRDGTSRTHAEMMLECCAEADRASAPHVTLGERVRQAALNFIVRLMLRTRHLVQLLLTAYPPLAAGHTLDIGLMSGSVQARNAAELPRLSAPYITLGVADVHRVLNALAHAERIVLRAPFQTPASPIERAFTEPLRAFAHQAPMRGFSLAHLDLVRTALYSQVGPRPVDIIDFGGAAHGARLQLHDTTTLLVSAAALVGYNVELHVRAAARDTDQMSDSDGSDMDEGDVDIQPLSERIARHGVCLLLFAIDPVSGRPEYAPRAARVGDSSTDEQRQRLRTGIDAARLVLATVTTSAVENMIVILADSTRDLPPLSRLSPLESDDDVGVTHMDTQLVGAIVSTTAALVSTAPTHSVGHAAPARSVGHDGVLGLNLDLTDLGLTCSDAAQRHVAEPAPLHVTRATIGALMAIDDTGRLCTAAGSVERALAPTSHTSLRVRASTSNTRLLAVNSELVRLDAFEAYVSAVARRPVPQLSVYDPRLTRGTAAAGAVHGVAEDAEREEAKRAHEPALERQLLLHVLHRAAAAVNPAAGELAQLPAFDARIFGADAPSSADAEAKRVELFAELARAHSDTLCSTAQASRLTHAPTAVFADLVGRTSGADAGCVPGADADERAMRSAVLLRADSLERVTPIHTLERNALVDASFFAPVWTPRDSAYETPSGDAKFAVERVPTADTNIAATAHIDPARVVPPDADGRVRLVARVAIKAGEQLGHYTGLPLSVAAFAAGGTAPRRFVQRIYGADCDTVAVDATRVGNELRYMRRAAEHDGAVRNVCVAGSGPRLVHVAHGTGGEGQHVAYVGAPTCALRSIAVGAELFV